MAIGADRCYSNVQNIQEKLKLANQLSHLTLGVRLPEKLRVGIIVPTSCPAALFCKELWRSLFYSHQRIRVLPQVNPAPNAAITR